MTQEAQDFSWPRCPQGEKVIKEIVSDLLGKNSFAKKLAEDMKTETGTRFFDWIESISLVEDPQLKESLINDGFEITSNEKATQGDTLSCIEHNGAVFPKIYMSPRYTRKVICIKVEDLAFFLQTHKLQSTIQGLPYSDYREALASSENGVEIWATERRGSTSIRPKETSPDTIVYSLRVLESFRRRKRNFTSTEEAFEYTSSLITEAQAVLPSPWINALWFQAEREYWMSRNRAAQVQKKRQDALGLGWANHDHHTYRSSRKAFKDLISLLELLGMECRERFYAGKDAGWGAQVLEHPDTGVVIFADVDLSPEEVSGDFSHDGLSQRDSLGTIGLWCGLHGESIFAAGMHHLECQFDFDALAKQLDEEANISMIKPFSSFPYLKQQFTEGERWQVPEENLVYLLEKNHISKKDAEKFRKEGAIGSHLENLERNEGFKGFNQTGVSEIIEHTNPKNH